MTTPEENSGGWDRTADTRLMKPFNFQPARGRSTIRKWPKYAPKTIMFAFPGICRLEPAAVILVPDDASECQREPGVVQAGYKQAGQVTICLPPYPG
jgi:hypothetical protein